MRRRTLTALGAVAATALAGGAVLASPPLTPPATAGDLATFTGCDDLLAWYVDSALPMVGPWGLGSGYGLTDTVVVSEARGAAEPSAGSAEEAVGNSASGTNVQEGGVDEPDIAKTDGEVVVHIDGSSDVVVTDVTGRARELSRTALPPRMSNPELLLDGDRVVVIGQDGFYGGPVLLDSPVDSRISAPWPGGGESGTSVVTIDISDPASPDIESRQRYGGSLVSTRQYDGVVRLVITTGTPTIDFVAPDRDRSPAQSRAENRRIVRASTVEDWLPSVTSGSRREPLLACSDVRHPDSPSGLGTISVVTFDAGSPGVRSATAVTAAGDLVYSSVDRLYLATAAGGWFGDPIPLAERVGPGAPTAPHTDVHAFSLERMETTYVASGTVAGQVRDRWSLSEYDGHLRVATALGRDPWNPRENAVVVLAERGDDLVEVGRVTGMGLREQIQSVRWFGDLAVLVTFRQVDPLYTVDLSDPTAPKVLGSLKIPGFSSYLHPVGDDLLLGLGQNATRRGVTLGSQAAVFDISDLSRPRRVDTVSFGRATELTASWESRAFTYLPDRHTALTPVQHYGSGRTRLAILKIGPDSTVTAATMRPIGGWSAVGVRTLPLDDGQVALVANGRVTKLAV